MNTTITVSDDDDFRFVQIRTKTIHDLIMVGVCTPDNYASLWLTAYEMQQVVDAAQKALDELAKRSE